MTALKRPELTDDEIVMIITGLDMIARQLGGGQQQGGLAAIQEVGEKSKPILALAAKLQAFLPKPDAPKEHDGPPASAKVRKPAVNAPNFKKMNGNGAHA